MLFCTTGIDVGLETILANLHTVCLRDNEKWYTLINLQQ